MHFACNPRRCMDILLETCWQTRKVHTNRRFLSICMDFLGGFQDGVHTNKGFSPICMDGFRRNRPESLKKSIQICKNKRFVWTFTKITCFDVAHGFSPCLSCRPKGRSAPLAWCLPRATGRRCCHGALPHRVWRPGAPLTALKNCGTQARSKAEGVNTHRSLTGGADRRLRGRISPRKLRQCVWIKGKSPIRSATNSELWEVARIKHSAGS